MTISGGRDVSEIEISKYLGFFVKRNGGFDEGVKHKIKCGWIKWKETFGVYAIKEFQGS